MVDLVAVCVTLRSGQFDHRGNPTSWPDYSALQARHLTGGRTFDDYVALFVQGWEIDQDEAMALVPVGLAAGMLELHPAATRICTEAEYETFLNKLRQHEPDVIDDVTILQAIAAKAQIARARQPAQPWTPDADDVKALDPAQTRVRGRRRNTDKLWADVKGKKVKPGDTILDALPPPPAPDK